MQEGQLGESRKTMKSKESARTRSKGLPDSLDVEHRFDYKNAQPNRFAGRLDKKAVVVLLAPDVAKVFKDGESVNNLLRAVINAYPRRRISK